MRTDLFDFELPEHLIALRPVNPRDAAKLLTVGRQGSLADRAVRDLPELLRSGDVLVLNDTRVIAARLFGRRLARDETGAGAAVEVTLIKRVSADTFRVLARPGKRLKPGDRILLGETLAAQIVSREGADVELKFEREGAALDHAIAAEGEMPLPPYIASRRAADARDRDDYQTVYADRAGSVAAPTAGLHFTPSLLEDLKRAGVGMAKVTLHVGPGTFLPVSADDTKDHVMHPEWACVDTSTAEAVNTARAKGGRIIAVGTTALRTLESAADESGRILPFTGETRLFITPGYRFKAVDMLLTNFHLPRSTLFMLVCAFTGTENMRAAYAHAVAEGYRFYSYGDASLLERAE